MEERCALATLLAVRPGHIGRRLLVGLAIALVLGAVPAGTAAAASPTFRLSILHTVQGCHVWMTTKALGPSTRITLKRGTRVAIRVVDPMDFDVKQTAGPRLALGGTRVFSGTTRTIAVAKRGVYRLTARNVQSSAQLGLQTVGPDNLLTLTIVAR